MNKLGEEPDKKNNVDEGIIIEEKVVKVSGEIFTRKYSKGKFLGKGGFAKCYEFTNLANEKVSAAKIIPKNSLKKSRHRQKLLSEIKIHRSLVHKNIVNFEHVFEDADNVYILLELCTNQTLNDLCKRRKRLTSFEAQYYIFQIVNSLIYLQKHKVIHRDLKLGNLFLSSGLEIKLGDFGLAAKLEFDAEKRHTVCGTPNYLAPEVLSNKSGHSFEVDIWSLGVVLYAILIGKPPFETPEVKMTYEKIRKCYYSFPESIFINDDAKNLIISIFKLDPSQRPTLSDILAHPFMNYGEKVSRMMHISTLAMAPTNDMINKMLKDSRAIIDKEDIPRDSKLVSQITNDEHLGNKKEKGIDEICIKKWVDYSTKYGLGYMLSNGNIGVFFNDCTKVIYNIEKQYFQYMERVPDSKTDSVVSYSINSFPAFLMKKVTLLMHFTSYLDNGNTDIKDADPEAKPLTGSSFTKPMIYLKKWLRTKHASLLRLSNKIVQVGFSDGTEIILSSESKKVTYVNKKGERITCLISNALESDNTELTKRLKYTKEILTVMLNQHRAKNSNA